MIGRAACTCSRTCNLVSIIRETSYRQVTRCGRCLGGLSANNKVCLQTIKSVTNLESQSEAFCILKMEARYPGWHAVDCGFSLERGRRGCIRWGGAGPSPKDRRVAIAVGRCWRWVHGAWHEAVTGSSGSAAASTTGIDGTAIIQHDGPPVAPPIRDRMSAARSAQLTLSTRCGPSLLSPRAVFLGSNSGYRRGVSRYAGYSANSEWVRRLGPASVPRCGMAATGARTCQTCYRWSYSRMSV